jgi:hypothetical protein
MGGNTGAQQMEKYSMHTAHNRTGGPEKPARDKIQRLHGELWKTLHAFLDQEDASSAVIATGCGQFVAYTFAGLSASSEDTTEHARRRLDLALDAFETSFWHEFKRLKG